MERHDYHVCRIFFITRVSDAQETEALFSLTNREKSPRSEEL